ncbi:hypothetical protein Tco_0784635 [Tanacetum coccineum]
MEAGTTSTTLTARLPILNPREYDLWLMRIEQYFLMKDYSLWEVILNGNKVLKRTVGETEQEYEPTTVEEKQDRRNEMKARGTLLMALPNKGSTILGGKIMGWVVCSDAVVESCDAILVFVVMASCCICDIVSSR